MQKKEFIIWVLVDFLCLVMVAGTTAYGKAKEEAMEQPQPTITHTPTVTLTPAVTSELTPTSTITPAATQGPVATVTPETVPTPAVTPEEEKSEPVQDDMPPAKEAVTGEPGKEGVPEEGILSEEAYASYDNTKQEWWFRRNTTHALSGSGEPFPIEPFDAYYANTHTAADDKVFYLTFDCGYENGHTPMILDILKKYNITATFFVTQDFLEGYPDYAKRMKEEGHLVGNHTVRHLSTPELSPAEIQTELSTVAETMYALTGYELDGFFRPPMGEYSERTLQVAKDLGYKTIFWSMAYYDYNVKDQPGKEYVIEHFKQYHHSGAIALIHTVSQSNTEALEAVIQLLLEEGYRFGSLLEL